MESTLHLVLQLEKACLMCHAIGAVDTTTTFTAIAVAWEMYTP